MSSFWNGYFASVCGLFAIYPIDTVKTHIQNNSVQSLQIRHLYNGVVSQLLFVGGAKSLRFVCYEELRGSLPTFWAGVSAGVVTSVATNPLEVYKTKKQMCLPFRVSDCYQGWRFCMLRESVMSGSLFYSRELFQEHIDSKVSLALISSLPGCVLSIPFDVFKTRTQTHDRPIAVVETVKREGLRVLWKGGFMRILKALPQTAITMYVYDILTTHVH